jgi:hypothetical protein
MLIAASNALGSVTCSESDVMVRNCAVIAWFFARMIAAIYDLGASNPAALEKLPLNDRQPRVVNERPIIVSGLPEDSGLLRR